MLLLKMKWLRMPLHVPFIRAAINFISNKSDVSRKSFPDEFVSLLKQVESEEDLKKLQKMIEDQALDDFVDEDGNHVLHLAAKFNNWLIIDFLADRGCNLEIEDSSGTTPMITALMHNSFEAGASLLYESAWRLIGSRSPPCHKLCEKVIQRIAVNLYPQLLDKNLSSEQIGEAFAQLHVSLITIINLHDPVMTKAYLQSEVMTFVFVNGEEKMLYETIMPTLETPCLQMILQNGRWSIRWTKRFCIYVMRHILNYQKTKAGRDFLRRIFTWEIINEENLKGLEGALKISSKASIKIFLQYKFHLTVKEKCGRDLLACLFANKYSKITSVLKNELIDVDGRGCRDKTPLHHAVKYRLPKNVEFLLKNGANPNALNDSLEAPIKPAVRESDLESLQSLLIAGADPAFTYNQFIQVSFFNADITIAHLYDHVKMLVSQIAIYEAMDLSIDRAIEIIYKKTNSPALKNFFEECRQQLKRLKLEKIRGNVDDREFTMLTILVEKPEKIARYISADDVQAIFSFVKSNRKSLLFFYRKLLKEHASDIDKINLRRRKAIPVICECTGYIYASNHLVIDKIISYLSFKDLLKFQ